MPRSVGSTVLTAFRSASGAQTIWLFEIPTGLGTTLRYTTAEQAVTWNSLTWSPLPAAPPSQRFDGPGESGGGVSLALGDADGTLSALVEAGATFEGQTMVVHLTDAAATGGSGSQSVPDEYVIEAIERGEAVFTIHARGRFGTFDDKVPRRVATRALGFFLSVGD